MKLSKQVKGHDWELGEAVEALEAEVERRDKRIEELEAGQQASMDKALEEVAKMADFHALQEQPMPGLHRTGVVYSPDANKWWKIAALIRARIKGEGK